MPSCIFCRALCRPFFYSLFAVLGLAAPALAQKEMVTTDGQRIRRDFEGIVTLGVNGSQIDGDGLSGFNMPGLAVGFGSRYVFDPEWALEADILYSQKGSRTTLDDEAQGIPMQRQRLHYIELPVLATYMPASVPAWSLHGGVAISHLLLARGSKADFESIETYRWTRYDVSAAGGFEYRLLPYLTGMARWTYSLLPNNVGIGRVPAQNIIFDGAGVRNSTITVALRLNLSRLP